jgi:hypothetical protein
MGEINMKKLICLAFLFMLLTCNLAIAEEAQPGFPLKFSCKILEERYKGTDLKSKRVSNYYQYENVYRVDVLGFTYILDDNNKKLYSVFGKEYTEEELKGEVSGYLNFCGVGFLNPKNVESISTGKTETINGYECEKKEVKLENSNEKIYIWQATALGNLALKYEESNSDSKTIKIISELNLNLTDISMFQLSKKGKKDIIIIDPQKIKN